MTIIHTFAWLTVSLKVRVLISVTQSEGLEAQLSCIVGGCERLCRLTEWVVKFRMKFAVAKRQHRQYYCKVQGHFKMLRNDQITLFSYIILQWSWCFYRAHWSISTLESTGRADAQMTHIHHTYRTSSGISPT